MSQCLLKKKYKPNLGVKKVKPKICSKLFFEAESFNKTSDYSLF